MIAFWVDHIVEKLEYFDLRAIRHEVRILGSLVRLCVDFSFEFLMAGLLLTYLSLYVCCPGGQFHVRAITSSTHMLLSHAPLELHSTDKDWDTNKTYGHTTPTVVSACCSLIGSFTGGQHVSSLLDHIAPQPPFTRRVDIGIFDRHRCEGSKIWTFEPSHLVRSVALQIVESLNV